VQSTPSSTSIGRPSTPASLAYCTHNRQQTSLALALAAAAAAAALAVRHPVRPGTARSLAAEGL
jgi:hypothetical protein